MKTIACLHTAAGNRAVFEAACPPGATLTHTLREDLLKDAEAAGGLTDAIADRTARALEALAVPGVDAVLLTCSTVGPGAARAKAPVPVLRVDAALAEEATKQGGKVIVLCAVETTVEPTRAIFAEAASRNGAMLDVRLVPGAWAAFRGGDVEGAKAVALAQASMSGAVAMAKGPKPLASPPVGLAAALAA
jgi:hypothetical protein